jgi:hypothetical protein
MEERRIRGSRSSPRTPRREAGRRAGRAKLRKESAWRVAQRGRIVIAYQDYFYAPDGEPVEDLYVVGKTRFDLVASTLCKEFATTPPVVASVQPDDVGDYSLCFSNDYRLDVFPAESDETIEHWRIFQPGVESKYFAFNETAD